MEIQFRKRRGCIVEEVKIKLKNGKQNDINCLNYRNQWIRICDKIHTNKWGFRLSRQWVWRRCYVWTGINYPTFQRCLRPQRNSDTGRCRCRLPSNVPMICALAKLLHICEPVTLMKFWEVLKKNLPSNFYSRCHNTKFYPNPLRGLYAETSTGRNIVDVKRSFHAFRAKKA
jgi:hypothetical protein